MKLTPANISIIKRLLVGRNNRPLRSLLTRLQSADLASLFSSLNRRETHLFVDALRSVGKLAEVLVELPEPHIVEVMSDLPLEGQVDAIQSANIDEASFIVSVMDEEDQGILLSKIPDKFSHKIEQYLRYPEDSAGRIMQTEVFRLPSGINALQGLEQLREKAQEQSIYYIYCTDDNGVLVGVVSLRQLATVAPETPLMALVKKDVVTVQPEESEEDVAEMVARYDFVALPVVDKESRLLGVVTVDDVVDIIQEQATADIYATAGLQEDDRVYTSAATSIKNRLPWMFLNLFLAALASSVVSLFEQTMSQLIILASVKNIVAGIGGNTAIQTLTVVTRGLAVGDFSFISHAKAILKETSVGLVIGVFTGFGAGLLIYFWKGDAMVAVVIFVSMVLNSVVASSFGALVPITLKKFNFDPAIGSGVLVTMITDIFGFLSFLGIATIGLKMVS